MADVFVSYSREDREIVVQLVSQLQKLGLQVWYDAEMDAGAPFQQAIRQELTNARAVVVCWSKTSTESDWVLSEAEKARESEKFASVSIESCELPMPYGVLHSADLADWDGQFRHAGFRQLIRRLSSLFGQAQRLNETYNEALQNEREARSAGFDVEDVHEIAVDQIDLDATERYCTSIGRYLSESDGREIENALTHARFESEILGNPRTKWIVGPGEAPDIPIPNEVRFTNNLDEALNLADNGDIVVVFPGLYKGHFAISNSIRLIGFGFRDRPVLAGIGSNNGAILSVSASAIIENMLIESRQGSHALLIRGQSSPVFTRCVVSKFNLLPNSDWSTAHVESGSKPRFIGCMITGRNCHALSFAGASRGSVLSTEVSSRDAGAIMLSGSAKPHFSRCRVTAYNGHAVLSKNQAAGLFESCNIKATHQSAVVNDQAAFTQYRENTISVSHGSIIEVRADGRGRFERNRLMPCPDLKAVELLQSARRSKFFWQRNPTNPTTPPIRISHRQTVRFSDNRLPDGSIATPPQAPN